MRYGQVAGGLTREEEYGERYACDMGNFIEPTWHDPRDDRARTDDNASYGKAAVLWILTSFVLRFDACGKERQQQE